MRLTISITIIPRVRGTPLRPFDWRHDVKILALLLISGSGLVRLLLVFQAALHRV